MNSKSIHGHFDGMKEISISVFSDELPEETADKELEISEESAVDLAKAVKTTHSFECPIEGMSKDFFEFLFGSKPKEPDNKEVSLTLQVYPETKRKINYAQYEVRWRKATSIRKAKKYARILGRTLTWDRRYNLPIQPRLIVFPKCTMETRLTQDETGRFIQDIKLDARKM
jgi:hypothetical protein